MWETQKVGKEFCRRTSSGQDVCPGKQSQLIQALASARLVSASCVTLSKLLKLYVLLFLHHKMGIMIVPMV